MTGGVPSGAGEQARGGVPVGAGEQARGGVPVGAGEQARWLEELEHCWCPTHGYTPGCPVHEQIIIPRHEGVFAHDHLEQPKPPAPSSLPDEEGAPAQDRIAQLEAELAASRAFSQALSAQLPHTTRVNFDEWVAEEGEAQALTPEDCGFCGIHMAIHPRYRTLEKLEKARERYSDAHPWVDPGSAALIRGAAEESLRRAREAIRAAYWHIPAEAHAAIHPLFDAALGEASTGETTDSGAA